MSERIGYLDAMRGLAMLMVVFVHIEGFCFFNLSFLSYLGSIISIVQLPLFFYISGMLAYNTKCPTFNQIKRKAFVLQVPMLILGLTYTYICLGMDVTSFVNDAAKLGYWFTLVLFEMYLIYYVVKYIAYKCNLKNNAIWIWALVFTSIIMYLGKYPMRMLSVLDCFGNLTSLHYTMNFFQYFVLGLFVMHFRDTIDMFYERCKNCMFLKLLFIVIFFAATYYKYYALDPSLLNNSGMGKILSMLLGTFCGYISIFLIYFLFRKYNLFFSKDNKIAATLKLVGRRTLDIYLIHYFILYVFKLPQFGYLLKENIFAEISITLIMLVIVVTLSLLLSSLIRKNKITSRYLLGVLNK